MKNLLKIIFVLGFLLPVCVQGQAVTWQKWYDYNNLDNDASDVIQTFDGGYLFLGQNYGLFVNSSSVMIKTNSFGSIEWQQLMDKSVVGENGIICFSVTQSKDSGYVVSGYTTDSAVLIRTCSNGEIKWLKKYGKPGQSMTFYNHSITLDGGIIACGELYPPLGDGIIMKTDSIGNVEWDNINNIYFKVIQSKDSNYYFGTAYGILKTNKLGTKIWTKTLQTTIGPFILENNNAEFIYTGGYPGLDTMTLHKLDSSGNLVWLKKYYPDAHSQCICFSNNGSSILLAGYIDTLVQGNIAVTKVDLDGNLIFSKQIYSAFGNNLSFLPYAVKSTSDNGFILAGFTNYPRFTMYKDNILAVKTDSLCNAPVMVGINNGNINILSDFVLYQNYPNPFNPNTKIKFELKKPTNLTLKVYDNLGKEIITLIDSKNSYGKYSVQFSGNNLPSGVYYYKLETTEYSEVKKMILLK